MVSHCRKINKIIWNNRNKKEFITCSNDGLIFIFNYIGDRWQPKIIDISKTIDM